MKNKIKVLIFNKLFTGESLWLLSPGTISKELTIMRLETNGSLINRNAFVLHVVIAGDSK